VRHVPQFSGGVGSWAAARRVVDQYGTKDVTLLVASTNYEASDWQSFLTACICDLSCEAVILNDGRSIWDVFHDERFLGNTRVDVCSKVLKREPLRKWLEKNCDPEDTIVYLGFDWTEEHRLHRARERWLPWRVEAPLCDPPYTEKQSHIEELTKRGIPIPALYTAGFPHNNCGGACVKAGQAQWAKLLTYDRERYLDAEMHENKLREELGDVAILRDRRGGTTKPYTLEAFRHNLEGKGEFERDDWGACSCMESGPG
jgi:hypothetical protein